MGRRWDGFAENLEDFRFCFGAEVRFQQGSLQSTAEIEIKKLPVNGWFMEQKLNF